jgi:hypothetical protein
MGTPVFAQSTSELCRLRLVRGTNTDTCGRAYLDTLTHPEQQDNNKHFRGVLHALFSL